MLEDILIPIVGMTFSLGAPAAIIWQIVASRHRERQTIIEHGLDPAQYAVLYARSTRPHDPFRALMWALILILAGGGYFLGSWMQQVYNFPHATTAAITLMGAGIGLLTYFIVAMRARKNATDTVTPQA